MKDQLDPKLGENALEQSTVEDRSRELTIDLAANRQIQAVEIERDDAAVTAFRETGNEPVPDFAAGAGD